MRKQEVGLKKRADVFNSEKSEGQITPNEEILTRLPRGPVRIQAWSESMRALARRSGRLPYRQPQPRETMPATRSRGRAGRSEAAQDRRSRSESAIPGHNDPTSK